MRRFFLTLLISGLVCLAVTSQASAAGGLWLGFGATPSWDDPGNWENGVPLLGDFSLARYSETSVSQDLEIGTGVVAETGLLILGNEFSTAAAAGPVTLTMTDGSLEILDNFHIGRNGGSAIFDLSGSLSAVTVEGFLIIGNDSPNEGLHGGEGTVNQAGGTFTTTGMIFDWHGGGGFGDLDPNFSIPATYNLSGGLLEVTTANNFHFGSQGLLDITQGVMTIGGDSTAKVDQFIAASQFTAYGGAGTVLYDFDVTNPGLTTVWAVDAGAADFDENSIVDGVDFLAWQRGFGIQSPNANKSDGDADLDLDVDHDDLDIWEAQYGMTTPLVGAIATVPEPASALLLGAGALMLVGLRRGRGVIV